MKVGGIMKTQKKKIYYLSSIPLSIPSVLMFLERSQTSLVHRILEGISAGLSFFVVGLYQQHDRWLWITYFVHWCFAFYFHLTYSMSGHMADREMIRVLIGERLQRVDSISTKIVRCWYIFQPTTKDVRIMAIFATLITAWRLSSWYYLVYHGMALVCNFMSDVLIHGHGSTLFNIFFHVFLAMATGLETVIESSPTGVIQLVMRYACWFMAILRIMDGFTQWPETKMFRVCTLTCALVLSPIGLYEWIKKIMTSTTFASTTIPYIETPYTDIELMLYDRPPHVEELDYRIHSLCCYLAYVMVDTYLGITRFPDYFRWLEGLIHHGLTGAVAFFCIFTGNTYPGCVAMIAELPTIIMTLRHFISIPPWIFPLLFVVFRIIVLGYMVHVSFWEGQMGWIWVIFYIIFTFVNVHWFTKMIFKMN
uniref:TLC domain-containing protein n=1 Tax=viral metagenome TaxID=1070528 RepID=A0A6C0D104_9ZZZZ